MLHKKINKFQIFLQRSTNRCGEEREVWPVVAAEKPTVVRHEAMSPTAGSITGAQRRAHYVD
jgi:hypothetical protein